MTLIRFEPMKEMERWSDRIQKYFDEFPSIHFSDSFSPRIDISEDDKNIIIDADIPGIKKEDLKLTLEDNVLTIQGEKKIEEENEKRNYFRRERSYGSFKRSFTLPMDVDSEKVEAKFNDGSLKITLPKIEEKVKKEKVIDLK